MNLSLPSMKNWKEGKQQESAQQQIPIRTFFNGAIVTTDMRLVKILRVSTLNLELMSQRELSELFASYESVLKSVPFAFQTTMVSQPVNLNSYIDDLEEQASRVQQNFKKRLFEEYIQYARDIQREGDIIQRQHFLVFDEKIKGDTVQSLGDAYELLEEKRNLLVNGLNELNLSCKDLTETEIIQYFHVLFDYQSAQWNPVLSAYIPQLIEGGMNNEVAKTKGKRIRNFSEKFRNLYDSR